MVEDRPKPPGEEITVDLYVATPGYLRAMEIELRRGRGIEDQDGEESARVALINRTMAEQLWAGEDPLGRAELGERRARKARELAFVDREQVP